MTVNSPLSKQDATPIETDAVPDTVATSKAGRPSRRPKRGMLVALAAAGAIGLGATWIILPGSTESTDDAYVDVDASVIAPRVRGFISKVLVTENRPVHAGDPLFVIDPEEFDARLENAKADVADAQAGERSAEAALGSLAAEERLARAEVSAAGTVVRSAEAEKVRATADSARFQTLALNGNASHSTAGRYRAEAVAAEQEVARVQALLRVAHDKVAVVRSRRAILEAALAKARATTRKAQAALRLAEQDRRHSVIFAPIDGVAANRHGNPGDYVQPGTQLLTIVPARESYVTAYFKETQIARMRQGQQVTVELDASDEPVEGYVDSLAPGSGSQFALLPFEPGTGNFTKIVQRVPVRIRFKDPDNAVAHHVRPGLSATVTVHLKP